MVNQLHMGVIILAVMLQAMMFPGNTFTAEQFETGITAPDSIGDVPGFALSLVTVAVSFPLTFFQLLALGTVPGMPAIIQAGFSVYSVAVLGPPYIRLVFRMADVLSDLVPLT